MYYPIGEVAEMFNVNTSLIRFWEKEFSIIQPKKNKKGNRLFTLKDIENFNKIYHLVKMRGFTLEGAKKAIKEKEPIRELIPEPQTNSKNDELINRLESIREKLISLKNQL